MSNLNNSQKITKPLARPSSGQQKRTLTAGPSKMEVLPPEKNLLSELNKPQFSMKKEIKLERATGSAASKKSNSSIMSSTEVSGFDIGRPSFDMNAMNQTSRSQVDNQVQEDLKKISSKPFSTKAKLKKTSTVEGSTELSSKSTNIDATQAPLSTPGKDMMFSEEFKSQELLSNLVDDDGLTSTKQNLEYMSQGVDDLLMYDQDEYKEEKEEPNIEIDINFEELHKKFEEMAVRQIEIETIAKDYVAHILNAKSDTGENLVNFPQNFQEIVDNTVEEARTMEDLKEKGIVSNDGIHKFIREQMTSSLNQEQKAKDKKEDPYAKEKEKIRELDRILAQKEREYRQIKETQKLKRFQEIQDFDEQEMSMENIDRIFLTDWKKKSKSTVTTAQLNNRQQKGKQNEPAEEKVISTKPKISSNKNHIKKNIETAFARAKEPYATKFTEEEQRRIDQFMAAIDKMIEGQGSEDELLNEIIPNPYNLNGGEAQRMQEINKKMAEYSLDKNLEKLQDPIQDLKLPKDKALRDQAEKRALQDANDLINRKLMEFNDKDKLNQVYDSNIIIALAEQLKQENPDLYQSSSRKKLDEENDEVENQLKEIASAISKFDTDEMLNDLGSLSQQAQSIQKQIQSIRMDLSSRIEKLQDDPQKSKKRKELIDSYTQHKDALDKLDSETVQNDMDALSKLEKKLNIMERNIFEAENKLFSNAELPATTYENVQEEDDKTLEDYDREFMEKLKLTNPELFSENIPVEIYKLDDEGDASDKADDEVNEDGTGIDKNAIIEEAEEDYERSMDQRF